MAYARRGVLALDLALRVGWAFGLDADAAPHCGVWVLPSAADLGRRYAALGNELADALALHQPRLVLMEAPLVRQDNSARLLLGLAAHVESTCYRWGVECREAHSATVRKAVLGRGTFPKGTAKAAVLAFCTEQGWPVPDDNAADACLVWAYARQERQQRRAA